MATKPSTTAVAWVTWRRSGHCTRWSSAQLARRKPIARLPPRSGAPDGLPGLATTAASAAAAAAARRPRPAGALAGS